MLEVKTPAYYKDFIGNLHYINESGQLITVRNKMINMWELESGRAYTEEIETLLSRDAKPCTKEEFDNAYQQTMDRFKAAICKAEEINS